MKDINKRVRQYRQLLGLSQSRLAELLGKKSSTYSQLERCGTFTCDTLLKLADIFEVNAAVLLYGVNYTDEPLPPPPPPTFVFTENEINLIKIIRNLPSNVRKEIISFIQLKYKENK